MIGFGSPVEIELDASRFSDDNEARRVAEVVARHAEKRRREYRATEQPMQMGGLIGGGSGYWSNSVPWYEWMTDLQVLEPCANECQIPIFELANVIAYKICPVNWQVFSWMGMALSNQNHGEILKNLMNIYADTLVAMHNKKKSVAIAAANARHSQPGGSREKQEAIRAIWQSGKYASRDECAEQECAHLGMSFSAARKALRNVPNST